MRSGLFELRIMLKSAWHAVAPHKNYQPDR
jgi:hypothetical protein